METEFTEDDLFSLAAELICCYHGAQDHGFTGAFSEYVFTKEDVLWIQDAIPHMNPEDHLEDGIRLAKDILAGDFEYE